MPPRGRGGMMRGRGMGGPRGPRPGMMGMGNAQQVCLYFEIMEENV